TTPNQQGASLRANVSRATNGKRPVNMARPIPTRRVGCRVGSAPFRFVLPIHVATKQFDGVGKKGHARYVETNPCSATIRHLPLIFLAKIKCPPPHSTSRSQNKYSNAWEPASSRPARESV